MAGRKKASVNYLSNENLLREIALSKERFRTSNIPITRAEALTPTLVNMLQLLVENVSQKYNWRNYSYLSDMKGDARFALCQNALKFDETKTQNPFSYYTQIVWSCFLSYLDKEKKVSRIRDALLEEQEMTPSFRRQMENEEEQRERPAPVYKPTAEDEAADLSLREQLDRINEVIKAVNPETTVEDHVAMLIEIFGMPNLTTMVYEDLGEATCLLPPGTTWRLIEDVPPEYGVTNLLEVITNGGTKITKGFRERTALPGMIVLAALSLKKDEIVKANKGVAEAHLRWSSKGNGNGPAKRGGGAFKKSPEKLAKETSIAVEIEPVVAKKRGRKPAVKSAAIY